MKTLRRTLLEGAMVVIPMGAVVLLIIGIIQRLKQVADPLTGHALHPLIPAATLLVVLILLVGLLVRWGPVRRARLALEATLFDKIPGYRLVKAVTGDGPLTGGQGRTMRPALAAIEEGLCPALVMDEFADGRLLVFVPGSPAPMSGALYIFTPDKVTYLEVPLMAFMRAISSWGLGLKEMVEGGAGPGRVTAPLGGAPDLRP